MVEIKQTPDEVFVTLNCPEHTKVRNLLREIGMMPVPSPRDTTKKYLAYTLAKLLNENFPLYEKYKRELVTVFEADPRARHEDKIRSYTNKALLGYPLYSRYNLPHRSPQSVQFVLFGLGELRVDELLLPALVQLAKNKIKEIDYLYEENAIPLYIPSAPEAETTIHFTLPIYDEDVRLNNQYSGKTELWLASTNVVAPEVREEIGFLYTHIDDDEIMETYLYSLHLAYETHESEIQKTLKKFVNERAWDVHMLRATRKNPPTSITELRERILYLKERIFEADRTADCVLTDTY